MPASRRSDARALIVAAAAVTGAGLLVAVLILVATGRGGSPREDVPLDLGVAAGITQELRDGGPYYVANPFGGRGIILALEDGEIVALSITRPGTDDCTVRWRDSKDGFQDCDGNVLQSTDLARYATRVETEGDQRGELLVDLRQLLPAPRASPTG